MTCLFNWRRLTGHSALQCDWCNQTQQLQQHLPVVRHTIGQVLYRDQQQGLKAVEHDLPFQLAALDWALSTAVQLVQQEAQQLQQQVNTVTTALLQKVSWHQVYVFRFSELCRCC